MNPIYQQLFDTYGCCVLDAAEAFDEQAINAGLGALPLDSPTKNKLNDLFYDHYLRWSTDAFAVGVHLGLSLRNDIRRGGSQ